MKIMKTLRVAMAALLTLTLCAQGLPSASAASGPLNDKECSLAVRFAPDNEAMVGIKFEAWQVGELTQEGWKLLEKIENYNVLTSDSESWKDSNKASTLLGYLRRDNLQPDYTALTNENGMAYFGKLARGLYLVAGERGTRGETTYTPTPYLVTVPYENMTDVMTNVKYTSSTSRPSTVDRHVLKSWNDAGHENERPTEIVVDLFRDGELYDSVTLTAENNWRHDWSGLDAASQWMVVERETGRYSVVVEQVGITFHITNTLPGDPEDPPPPPPPDEPEIPDNPPPLDGPPTEEPEPPMASPPDDTEIPDEEPPLAEGPKLPQTGQLWWPVAPMVLGGIALMALGWKRRRDWSASDET